ncbi:deoxynucleoside kinase [Priestia aryabhattai]|uniref:deoxynucleoside kinase n=1 Tax=Priestia TaxID=2800373 RepID=UPI000BA0C192|nr:deoxynucleoside kinase [Priestia flexa]MDT2044727.1 deoxynucleoside kinase [Priestia flexa]OZT10656.1 deoxynucleoside kinase [Priestia aryabhattai]USY55183.1 deoxynucleoside kinase [Bacillus sp. 1780r2a1]
MGETPFITVEGPIGVGKTSLAKAIADAFQFQLLKEIVDENPFLGKFYEDIEEWSFQTEMFFLCNRYKQLEDIQKHFLHQHQPVVADYHIMKNMIFAQQTLKDSQYIKYVQIYDILTHDMPKPNIVIYLNASLPTLLERIKMRGREIEKNIDPSYLAQLSSDYEESIKVFKENNPEVTVLHYSGDKLDFVKNKEHLEYIISDIKSSLLKRSSTI